MTKKPQELELTLRRAGGEVTLRIDWFGNHGRVGPPGGTRGKAVRHTRNRARPTADQIHATLDGLCEGAPAQDAQSALQDLRAG